MRLLLYWTAALIVMAGDALAQTGRWTRAESPGFIVYSTASEQRITGVVEELESFDALLRRMTNAPAERSPTKLEVFLLSSNQFEDAFPSARDTIRGIYSARPDQIGAFAIFSDSYGLDAQEVLFHEYAHHFMFQYFANAYPTWYVEGFAEFVQTAVMGSERIVLGRSADARAQSLFNEIWLPMETLITAAPGTLSPDDAAKFYAQSWLFVHYLTVTPGKLERFQAYIRALRLGQEAEAAFETGFGMTPDQMQGELRRYLRRSPNAIALTRPTLIRHSAITMTRLPQSADRLLPHAARLRRGVPNDQAAALLGRVRELSTSRDEFATLTLARAEAMLGDTNAARALLEPYLAANPDSVEGLYLMGLTYLTDAGFHESGRSEVDLQLLAQGRRYLSRAFRIDGNHVPTLYRYAQSYDGVAMDETTWNNYMNVLLLANQLAPQIDEISMNAAGALIAHGRHREAIPLLRAVAYDPHAGSGAQRARQMLQEAEAAVSSAAPAQ
ncbi:MAG: hypothetical protein AB7H66_09730 [Hyphomonadaceae bacterium]